MDKLPGIATVGVGLVAVLFAMVGLLGNFATAAVVMSGALSEFHKQEGLVYFNQVFYTMSGVCIACNILLIFCGLDLLFVRYRRAVLLTEICVFEVIYFFAIRTLCQDPTIGRSVSAAMGVANAGMMFPWLTLFPLWAPLLLWWAKQHAEPKIRYVQVLSFGYQDAPPAPSVTSDPS